CDINRTTIQSLSTHVGVSSLHPAESVATRAGASVIAGSHLTHAVTHRAPLAWHSVKRPEHHRAVVREVSGVASFHPATAPELNRRPAASLVRPVCRDASQTRVPQCLL